VETRFLDAVMDGKWCGWWSATMGAGRVAVVSFVVVDEAVEDTWREFYLCYHMLWQWQR